MSVDDQYFVVDIRQEWRASSCRPFITFWRPENKGYTYSLERAGTYNLEGLEFGYHYSFIYPSKTQLARFPVPCSFVREVAHSVPVELLSRYPDLPGPIVMNNGPMRQLLRKHRLVMSGKNAELKR